MGALMSRILHSNAYLNLPPEEQYPGYTDQYLAHARFLWMVFNARTWRGRIDRSVRRSLRRRFYRQWREYLIVDDPSVAVTGERTPSFEEAIPFLDAITIALSEMSNRVPPKDWYSYNTRDGGAILSYLPSSEEDNEPSIARIRKQILNNFIQHCCSIKSALVKMKTPAQLQELVERSLDDLLKALGSQLNPARVGDVSRWNENKSIRSPEDIEDVRDKLDEIRVGLQFTNLVRLFAIPIEFGPDDLGGRRGPINPHDRSHRAAFDARVAQIEEQLRQGNFDIETNATVMQLWPAIDNYRAVMDSNYYDQMIAEYDRLNKLEKVKDPSYKGKTFRVYYIVNLWQYLAWYLRNTIRLLDLNEFVWVYLIIETMADTLTRWGPIPTDHVEFEQRPREIDAFAFSTEPWVDQTTGRRISQADWLEQRQVNQNLVQQRADARRFQLIALSVIAVAREGVARDTLRKWARELFAEGILARHHIQSEKEHGLGKMDPFLIDPQTGQTLGMQMVPVLDRTTGEPLYLTGTNIPRTRPETNDEYRLRLPRAIMRQGRANLFANWFRRVDYLMMVQMAERMHPRAGFRSIKWQFFMDQMFAKGFAAGYGNQEQSLKMIEDFGTLCLVTGIYDDFVAGWTEAEIFRPTVMTEEERREKLEKALDSRKTLLFLVNNKHRSKVGHFTLREDELDAEIRLHGEALTKAQIANRKQFMSVKVGAIDPREDHFNSKLLDAIVLGKRKEEAANYEDLAELTGALLGWTFEKTHCHFNWDFPFAAYFEEHRHLLYEGEGTLEQYYDRHYMPRLLRLHGNEKDIPDILHPDNVRKMPTPIWDWLYVPMLAGRRPILIPRCSQLHEYVEGGELTELNPWGHEEPR